MSTYNHRKSRGGTLRRNRAFNNILSIGYELETHSLAKLTKMHYTNDEGVSSDIFLNTDTKNIDIQKMAESDMDEDDEDIIMRQEEYTSFPVLDKHGDIDTSAEILITNDIVPETHFGNMLLDMCTDEDGNDLDDKDLLYKIRVDGKDYDLHFIYADKAACDNITGVEWIGTYRNPQRHRNIILETFFNFISNLVIHFEQLEATTAKFMAVDVRNGYKFKVIGSPAIRSLFHLPDTSLYYIQTSLSDSPAKLDSISVQPQMTFTCKSKHAFSIMNALLTHKFATKETHPYSETLNKAVKFADKLFANCPDKRFNSPEIRDIVNPCIRFIFLKLYAYYNSWMHKKKPRPKYLKNMLPFYVRHTNYQLYMHIKDTIIRTLSVSSEEAAQMIIDLFIQPTILQKYLIGDAAPELNIRKGVFSKTNVLDRKSSQYGNPGYSLLSYFHFFELPSEKDNIKDKEDESPVSEQEEEEEEEEEEEGSQNGGASPAALSSLSSPPSSILSDPIFSSSDSSPISNNSSAKSASSQSSIVEYYEHDWFRYSVVDAVSTTMDIKDDILFIENRSFWRILTTYMAQMQPNDTNLKLTIGKLRNLFEYYAKKNFKLLDSDSSRYFHATRKRQNVRNLKSATPTPKTEGGTRKRKN